MDRPELPQPDGQGPEWLTQVILDPPGWVNESLKLLAVVVAIAAVYRLYQLDLRLPIATQVEIQRVVTHVLGVMVATLAFVTHASLPYRWDVAAGALVGVGTAFAVQPVARRIGERVSDDEHERVMAGWAALLAVALVLPEPAGIQQSGYLVVNTRWYLAILCAAMVFYNVVLIQRERQGIPR